MRSIDLLYFCSIRVGRSVQYSEDSEAGEKRFRLSQEDEETDAGNRDVNLKKKKKKKKSWNDKELSSSHGLDTVSPNRLFYFIFFPPHQLF